MKLTKFYNENIGTYECINEVTYSMSNNEFRNKLIEDLYKINESQGLLYDDIYWVQFVVPEKFLKKIKFDVEDEINSYNLDTLTELIDCGYDLISYKYSKNCKLILDDFFDFDYTAFDKDKYKPIQDIIKFKMVLDNDNHYFEDNDEKLKLIDSIIYFIFNNQTPNYMVDWALLNHPLLVSKEVLKTIFIKKHLISDRVKKRIIAMSKHFDFHLNVIYSVIIGTKLDLPDCEGYSHKYIINKQFDNQLMKLFNNDVVEQYYKNIVTKEIHNEPMTESMFDLLFLNDEVFNNCRYDFLTRPLDSLINIEYYKEDQLIQIIQRKSVMDYYVNDDFLGSKILKKFNNFTNLRTRFAPELNDLI